ncbi:hypothetical protein BO70DRAFT_397276 [Aspergillus heteromorphus CBS 117.55]|uniref:Uncharacterized protein n=1 Tax=Aspergillus heteromorphus CBS 117.55 TaxID=1448321 RepID=A0A317W4P7_9EURO|nr:uncharacterized protein BO70DRAFT_397276 [Aspergillus heteromorphus CBS 117.55]PWY79160.1 hypothetical protein BO70DRAFT_397276 [Aspergillus heteromorphus CBS 117.55]
MVRHIVSAIWQSVSDLNIGTAALGLRPLETARVWVPPCNAQIKDNCYITLVIHKSHQQRQCGFDPLNPRLSGTYHYAGSSLLLPRSIVAHHIGVDPFDLGDIFPLGKQNYLFVEMVGNPYPTPASDTAQPTTPSSSVRCSLTGSPKTTPQTHSVVLLQSGTEAIVDNLYIQAVKHYLLLTADSPLEVFSQEWQADIFPQHVTQYSYDIFTEDNDNDDDDDEEIAVFPPKSDTETIRRGQMKYLH